MGRTVDSIVGEEALQRDLDKSEDWIITNHMKFNKNKCWILNLGRCSPGYVYRLGDEMLENSTTEKDMEVLINNKLNMSQVCPDSEEGQKCPGMHQRALLPSS